MFQDSHAEKYPVIHWLKKNKKNISRNNIFWHKEETEKNTIMFIDLEIATVLDNYMLP